MSEVDVALVVVRLAIGCWLLWSVPVVIRAASRSAGVRGVSVVIPARDEAASLPHLLRTLSHDVEVVVVDDHSSDGTAIVAATAGARVVESAPLPEGWIGKSWACEQGAAAASGDTLVFVDADVRFGDDGLRGLLAEHRERGGLVSVQPFHEPGAPVEHLAAIFNVIGFAGTDAATPLGRRRGARGAFGPVLATSRAHYERVGRHQAIRSSVVDDVALAGAYRAAGLPVSVLGGGDAISFRMYPDGFRQLVEGFTKNLAAGVRGVRPFTTLLVVAWMTLLVQATVAPVRSLVAGDGDAIAVAIGLYVVVAVQLWWMARRLGQFGIWVAALFPVSLVLFLTVFARSVVATARGSVSWRGRRVPTRRQRRR